MFCVLDFSNNSFAGKDPEKPRRDYTTQPSGRSPGSGCGQTRMMPKKIDEICGALLHGFVVRAHFCLTILTFLLRNTIPVSTQPSRNKICQRMFQEMWVARAFTRKSLEASGVVAHPDVSIAKYKKSLFYPPR